MIGIYIIGYWVYVLYGIDIMGIDIIRYTVDMIRYR